MSLEQRIFPERHDNYSIRRRIEFVGLLISGLLAAMMFFYVMADWLSGNSMTLIATPAGVVRENMLAGGAILDAILGTSAFYSPLGMLPLATAVLVAIVAPVIGVFLVHRQMALIGETLAHTAFAGVAVGLIFNGLTGWEGSLLYAAMIVSVAGAVGLRWLTKHTQSYGDVPIAIVLSGSFAVGTLLISWGSDFTGVAIDIEDWLTGDLSIITINDAVLAALMTVAVLGVVAVVYKQFLYITFDELAARVTGFNVDFYNTLLIAMTAIVVVGAIQILGVILVAAMLVVPVAAASQIAKSFRETLYLSIIIAEASAIIGVVFAQVYNLPSGGSIVVTAILFYIAAVVFSSFIIDRSVSVQQYG